jgi:hypothetical protein
MDMNNLVIETEFEGGEKILLRELELKKDKGDIWRTVRKNAEDATLDLYEKYCSQNKQQKEEMTKYGLENVLATFQKLDTFCGSSRHEIQRLKQTLEPIIKQQDKYPDAELFCPYGSFQTSAQYPSFTEKVQQFFEKVKNERLGISRKSFHMGIIRINRKITELPMFIGCLVLTVTQKRIGGYKTEGCIDMFASNRNARHWWALHPAVCFLHCVMGFGDKGSDLYLRGTTHPCNIAVLKLLDQKFPFIRVGTDAEYVPEFYSVRNKYVVKYSDIRIRVAKVITPVPLITTVSGNNDKKRYTWNRASEIWE